MILFVLNMIAALITMPFVIKSEDWCWKMILVYIMLCLTFTPIFGIPLYLYGGRHWIL